MNIINLKAALKEFFSAMDLDHYIEYTIFHDPFKPKIQLNIYGNFRTPEDALEECWEKNTY